MTGTGTQTDPYVVMNVDEFLEAAPENGSAYIKLGADIDMDGVQNQIVSFAELDGDGHKIVNMVTIADASVVNKVLRIKMTQDSKIKNTVFRACLVNLGGILIELINNSISPTLTMEKCDFSICCKKSQNRAPQIFGGGSSNYRANIHIKECVFDTTYESTDNTALLIGEYIKLTIEDSHIETNISANSNSTNGKILTATFINSYVTGSVDIAATSGNNFTLFDGGFYHTYFAIESQNRGKATLVGGTFYDTCFYDNQIWSGSTDITNSGKLYALPTEKCKDMDYLNSIGFYVAPGE